MKYLSFGHKKIQGVQEFLENRLLCQRPELTGRSIKKKIGYKEIKECKMF